MRSQPTHYSGRSRPVAAWSAVEQGQPGQRGQTSRVSGLAQRGHGTNGTRRLEGAVPVPCLVPPDGIGILDF